MGRFSSRLPLTTEVRPEGSEMAEGGIRYFRRISSIRENYGPLDFSSPLMYPQKRSGLYPAKLSLPTGILDGQGEENVP